MYLSENTLDDLMRSVLSELIKGPFDVYSTRSNGTNPSSEIIGAMLHLTNPRARLSRSETRGKPFSALGELLWYLSKSNDLNFIEYYIKQYNKESEDGKTIYGGYGSRFFNLRNEHNQIENITKLLDKKPSSRRAVIQLFDGADLSTNHIEIPCTCTLQFIIRNNKLNMIASLRSNDAYKGLPHDVFTFTMIQEIVARSLSIDIGEYYHSVGSLHLYDREKTRASTFIQEGYQSTKSPMPPMPSGDPWPQIDLLLDIEREIRSNYHHPLNNLDPYWADLARLLKIYSAHLNKDVKSAKDIKSSMSSTVFNTYIDKKIEETKTDDPRT